LPLSWKKTKICVDVKLLKPNDEYYVLAKSDNRVGKERSMRQRRLKNLWQRLHQLQIQAPNQDHLLLKRGAAKKKVRQGLFVNQHTITESR